MIITLKRNKKAKKVSRTKSSFKNRVSTFDSFYANEEAHTYGIGVKSKAKKSKPVMSYGEDAVAKYLLKNNIAFIREKEFKDLFNPQTYAKLRLDFYLPSLQIAIEYDGVQHFKVNNLNKTEENLQAQQYRDRIKNRYCRLNKINLIRIKYTEFAQIEEILNQELIPKSP